MNYVLLRVVFAILWALIAIFTLVLAGGGLADGRFGPILLVLIIACVASIIILRRSFKDLIFKNFKPSRTVQVVGIVLVVAGALLLINRWPGLMISFAIVAMGPFTLANYQMLLLSLAPSAFFIVTGLFMFSSNLVRNQT